MAIWPFWPGNSVHKDYTFDFANATALLVQIATPFSLHRQLPLSLSSSLQIDPYGPYSLTHTNTLSHTQRQLSHTQTTLSATLSLTHTHSLSLSLCFTHTRSLILLCFSFSKQGGDEKPRNRWWREQQVASMAESFARRELLWKMQVAPCMPP